MSGIKEWIIRTINWQSNENKKVWDGIFLSLSFILILWIIKLIEINFHLSFTRLGILPRTESGLIGIITAPLIHKDLLHLFNNSVPLLVAIFAITYFFPKVYFRILLFLYFTTHIFIWVFARGDSFHIGASGLVYACLSFLFFVSAFANNKNMLALSLIIIFIYGAMIWGILPVESDVSWESHLMGAVMGFVFAIIYRHQIPPDKKFEWEEEEEDIDQMTDEEINELIEEKMKVKYWYKKRGQD